MQTVNVTARAAAAGHPRASADPASFASVAGSLLSQGRRRAARQRGVTLLELLIVIALMGLIAGIALPMLGSGVSTTELRGSARQLAAGLRAARSEAVAQRRETFLALDVAGKRFKVDRDPREHALPQGVELKLFTAQNDLVDANVGAIRFFPDGGSNGGRITVASGARKFEVDIDWLTGRVAILD